MSYCLVNRQSNAVLAVGFNSSGEAESFRNDPANPVFVSNETWRDARVLLDETNDARISETFPIQPWERVKPTPPFAHPDRPTVQDRLPRFIKGAQAIVDAYWVRMNFKHSKAPTIQLEGNGVKYQKVVIVDDNGSSKSVYCFVDLTDGRVLKAASYKAPVTTNPRSNVFAADYGASGLTEHGVKYLR